MLLEHKTFRAFISGKRSNISPPKWQQGKMPKSGASAVSLSKARTIRLGAEWRWTHVRLDVDSAPHRIWICYHQGKQNYMALACKVLADGDMLVLGVLEHHGTHPGWHVHGCCKTTDDSCTGRLRYPDMVRIPSAGGHHRAYGFPSSDEDALDIAGRHFRIPEIQSHPRDTNAQNPPQLALFP